MNNIIFVLLMAIIDVIVLSLMKHQLKHYNPIYFVIAFIFYGIQPLIFYYSLKNGGNLGTNNILWDLLSDLLVLIIALTLFEARYNNGSSFYLFIKLNVTNTCYEKLLLFDNL
jgi:multidrug transporter EmrE-like cation transporter